jgi:Glycosyltransferase family 87
VVVLPWDKTKLWEHLMSNPIAVLSPAAKAKVERGVSLSPKQTFLFAVIILIAIVANAFRIGSTRYATFGTYWASGYAARSGLNPYVSYPLTNQMHILALGEHRIIADINLNPPCVLPFFSAMSRMTLIHFGVVWTAVSLILLLSTIWLLMRHRPTMQARQVVWLLLAVSVFDTFFGGQIYFLLMLLAALTWIFIDEPGELVSTVTLGLLVAIKPTTAFWPVFLFLAGRRRLALRSLAVTAVVSAAPFLFYGGQVYREWFDALKNDNHWILPTDIAIPAYFARLGHRDTGLLIAFALFAYLAWWIWRRKPSLETVSGLALCATLLCAPLAWYDYSLILAPVFVAHRWNKMETTAAFFLAAPYALGAFFLFPLGSRASLSAGGITYFAAVLSILISYLRHSAEKRERSTSAA